MVVVVVADVTLVAYVVAIADVIVVVADADATVTHNDENDDANDACHLANTDADFITNNTHMSIAIGSSGSI